MQWGYKYNPPQFIATSQLVGTGQLNDNCYDKWMGIQIVFNMACS